MARLRQTLADYVVVAISPALIMALIGSLVFFLLEVFYHGEYQARLQYIFALFVLATVLIGRISIEEGAGHAALFALPMGIVTALAMMRFVQFQGDISPMLHVVINLGLMGLVWFAAHELAYDCTVVDETLDASGAGLLDRAKTPRPAPPTATTTTPAATPGFARAQSFVDWLIALGQMFMNWFDRPRTSHVLGRWVVYFAAATLPLFGFGQLFVPAAEVGRRRYIFLLLLVYVASALGLLLTTSFLSLRRYLRQRQLEMPVTMTGSWLLVGGVLLAATVAIAAILPRPAAEYDVAKLPTISFGSPGQKQTSRAAQGRDGVEKQDPAAQQTKHDPEADKTVSGKQGDEEDSQSKAKSDQPGDDKQNDGQQSDNQQNGDQQQESSTKSSEQQPPAENQQQESGEQKQAEQDSSSSSSQPTSTPPALRSISLPSSLSDWVRWLVLGVLIVGSCVLAFIYRQQILAALRQFWAELVAAWQRLFGGTRGAGRGDGTDAAASSRRPRRLADFHDPFVTGMAQRMSAAALVEYSFAALEAWGREHACPRDEAQTPLEFAAQVARRSPAMATESQRLAEMYNMVAYGAATLSQRSNEHLRKLWQLMTSVSVA